MSVKQLGYVGFGVKDVDAWTDLMVNVLGFAKSEGEDEIVRFRMDDRTYRVAVAPSGTDDIEYIGLELSDFDELARLVTSLDADGVEVAAAPESLAAQRRVQKLFVVTDPDGLRIELYAGALVTSDPFVPGRPIHGFKTGELGLGHVVLRVRDRDKSEEFYKKLGLRVSDYGSGRLVFMRCNPRHHSVALMPNELAPGTPRIAHLMIEMNSLDDVGTALDLCLDGKAPVSKSLGKHVNDYSVSFYLNTPSGFEVEYAYGGRLVDEATWSMGRYSMRDVWGHRSIS